MKTHSLSFVFDGKERMGEAISAQVRREYNNELSAKLDFWQKIAIEKKDLSRSEGADEAVRIAAFTLDWIVTTLTGPSHVGTA